MISTLGLCAGTMPGCKQVDKSVMEEEALRFIKQSLK